MQNLTLAMLVVVTTIEFFVKGDYWGRGAFLPGIAQYLPEMFGVAATIVVILLGTRTRFQFVRPQYWIVFGALVVTIVCGVLVNGVDSGPIFAGIRTYLRAIPLFLLPAVIAYTDRQVQEQLKLLLAIALIQIPLAVEQRVKTGGGGVGAVTGDFTFGTLMISSSLSIFLICCICIVAALYVRKRLKLWQFVLLFVLLVFPTTINETKASLFFLPIGLLFAFVAASKPGRRAKSIAVVSGLLVLFVAVFFPAYDYMVEGRTYGRPLAETLGNPEVLERNLWKKRDVGTTANEGGRVDSIVVSLQSVSSDPSHLAFGYGIGNVSKSALGRGFTGQYFSKFDPFLTTAFARVVFELGVLGMALVYAFMWLIYVDARAVARRRDDMVGALAAGWTGVVAIIVLSTVYKDLIIQTSLPYLFWYFSGLIAAARMRIARAEGYGR
jgi:hypothetical protein